MAGPRDEGGFSCRVFVPRWIPFAGRVVKAIRWSNKRYNAGSSGDAAVQRRDGAMVGWRDGRMARRRDDKMERQRAGEMAARRRDGWMA